MKRFKYIPVLLFGILCCPVLVHAQVIRVTGSANLIVTGDAKLVLHDESRNYDGTIVSSAGPLVVSGNAATTTPSAWRAATLNNAVINVSYDGMPGWVQENTNKFIYLARAGSTERQSLKHNTQPFLNAWPNPARDRFTLTVYSDKAAVATLLLQDESGRVLERRRVNYTIGVNTLQWDLSKYAQGSYLLMLENAPGKYLQIVKQ